MDTFRGPVKAGLAALFAVGLLLLFLNPPSLNGAEGMAFLIGGALFNHYVAFPFISQVPFLMMLSFVLGLGLGAAQPMIMSLLYEVSPRGRQGEAVGLRTMMLNGSHTFIPLLSGALSAAAGTGPVFWIIAFLLGCGAWFAKRQVK